MEIQPPKGMRDFSAEEKIERDHVIAILKQQFERFGFNPLETPILERYDILSAKYAGGAEILKEAFTLTDQGERQLGLRYDLTVPLARFVAQHPDVKIPFKRYAIGTVYRDGPIKLGRYREFYQCDCDIVGVNSASADAQCLQLGLAVFDALGMRAHYDVNSASLLRVMLATDGVPADRLEEAMLSLDKFKKIGEEGVVKELEEKGISGNAVRGIIAIAQLESTRERLDAITERYGALPELERVRQVIALVDDDRARFDPSLSRGLSYYTGIVFEAFFEDSPITSSASAGGRYDRMIGAFTERIDEFPAVGISFGLEPIMEERKRTQESMRKSVVELFIIPIKTTVEAMALTQRARRAGINADVDLLGRNISKNLEYANYFAIPFVVILGRQEIEAGKCKLRNMQTGEEALLSEEELFESVAKR